MINSEQPTVATHSLSKSVFLHLFPGICILLFYLVATPYLIDLGFNPSFGVILGFLVVGIPIQLLILSAAGRKFPAGSRFTRTIVFTRKIPIWQYIVYALVFIIYAIVVSSIMGPVNEGLQNAYFLWLPDWFTNSSPGFSQDASTSIIVISFVALFAIDGLLNPIIEELYFRGYLLPRMPRIGFWVPLVHAVLFSLVHFWQPWNVLQIFILVLPLYYVVWWRKNVYISIVVHCLANTIGALLFLGQYLSN